jgi:hypothetical protein
MSKITKNIPIETMGTSLEEKEGNILLIINPIIIEVIKKTGCNLSNKLRSLLNFSITFTSYIYKSVFFLSKKMLQL